MTSGSPMPGRPGVILVYREPDLGEAWRATFAGVQGVQIVCGDITQIGCDAVVSPANSFGFMDGGLDYALSERFGWDLQERVQRAIAELPERELLVGRAISVETKDTRVPWLIVAPTMRVPMSFQIATSVNAYLAMKALLLEATSHPEIYNVAAPGLCTGVGRMAPEIAAIQMRAAYDEVMARSRERYRDIGEAQKQQVQLNPRGLIWDY
jgi:O-acetyl-ADP-ribose deacetylase (regulator of RNase III)